MHCTSSADTLDNICSTKITLRHFRGRVVLVPLAHACGRPWLERYSAVGLGRLTRPGLTSSNSQSRSVSFGQVVHIRVTAVAYISVLAKDRWCSVDGKALILSLTTVGMLSH